MKHVELKPAAVTSDIEQFGLLHKAPPFYSYWLLLLCFNTSAFQDFEAQNTGSVKICSKLEKDLIKLW